MSQESFRSSKSKARASSPFKGRNSSSATRGAATKGVSSKPTAAFVASPEHAGQVALDGIGELFHRLAALGSALGGHNGGHRLVEHALFVRPKRVARLEHGDGPNTGVVVVEVPAHTIRSEERRVGKEGRSRWS